MWVTVCCVRLSRHDDRLMIGFPSRECCCDESRGHRLVGPASAWSVVVGVHKNKRKRNVSWRNNMAPNGDTRGTHKHKHKHKHKSPLFDSKDTTTNEQHATEAVPTAAGASVQRFLSDDEFSSSMNSFSFGGCVPRCQSKPTTTKQRRRKRPEPLPIIHTNTKTNTAPTTTATTTTNKDDDNDNDNESIDWNSIVNDILVIILYQCTLLLADRSAPCHAGSPPELCLLPCRPSLFSRRQAETTPTSRKSCLPTRRNIVMDMPRPVVSCFVILGSCPLSTEPPTNKPKVPTTARTIVSIYPYSKGVVHQSVLRSDGSVIRFVPMDTPPHDGCV